VSAETRRLERERVLSLLYEAEIKDASIQEILAALPAAPAEFVTRTAEGVGADLAGLDAEVERYAIDWKLERMAAIDRNILRLGAWELISRPDLPVAVVISEAVELAKRFSTEESGKFVNGILSALAADARAAQ